MTSTAQPVKIRKPLGDRILTVVCYTIAIVFAIGASKTNSWLPFPS